MVKRKAILVLFIFNASLGLAAKAHREAAKEISPKTDEASAAVKTGCGCSPKFTLDMSSFDKIPPDRVKGIKNNIQDELEHLAKTAKEFCNDDESKKLFCSKVKEIKILAKIGGDPETTFGQGIFNITTSDQMASGGYGMKREMEKW